MFFGPGEKESSVERSLSSNAVMNPAQQWAAEETREFIRIRGELEREFVALSKGKSGKKQTLWEVVSARMRERGLWRTPDQCKCKWKNLINRYKAKETSNSENDWKFPFFDDLDAIFSERGKTMQRSLLESEAGFSPPEKRVKKFSGDLSSWDFVDIEEDVEDDSEEEKPARSNSRKRKGERGVVEKYSRASSAEKNSSDTSGGVNEMIREFFQQQQRMETQWREMMERNARERQLFEEEWHQSMEKLERERLMAEQAWREREEQWRIKEEIRAERMDTLFVALLNKLNHDNNL